MLTQLLTVKTRLGIGEFEVQTDAILINAIKGVSARFGRECRREFGRTVDARQEFRADETQLCAQCAPIESVARFELKSNESDGWVVQNDVEHLVRQNCVIVLARPLGDWREQGRVTYTGGYVLPGGVVDVGQSALPDDLEQAAVEQVVYWYQNRDKLGVQRQWPKGGTYEQFTDLDLLPAVRAVLRRHQRF